MLTQTHGVFVVRIWQESSGTGASVWRASVTNTSSKEKHYFAKPEALSTFLLARNVPRDALEMKASSLEMIDSHIDEEVSKIPASLLEFRRLNAVACSDVIALMNHSRVRKLMPLSKDDFNELDCRDFVSGKERLWEVHGFGPWAFYLGGHFAGWGGLQPEQGEADLALVLHPNFWGSGKVIYDEIIRRAFTEMGFDSVVIFFPPSRTRIKAIFRLGFKADGEAVIGGERFLRYRLLAPSNTHPV